MLVRISDKDIVDISQIRRISGLGDSKICVIFRNGDASNLWVPFDEAWKAIEDAMKSPLFKEIHREEVSRFNLMDME